ncbi:MAG TPA: DUF4157 domain-containing protein [Nostocaceae cyanobacterium]|nr:DUF4157 domain-containing protein [Nostocaceae cyanobacterium]
MDHQQVSQTTSPSLLPTSKTQNMTPNLSYGSLSSVVQRAQQDPNSVNEEEREQLERAIGTRSTQEIFAGKQTPWIPEFEGISAQLWGDSGQVEEPIQAKLTIGEVGDKYEQEADRIACQVVNQINAPQNQGMLQEEMPLQASRIQPKLQRYSHQNGIAAPPDLDSSIQQVRGGGQPLADRIRQPMEQAFGADFSGVKVHTDTQADMLNCSLGARAFTTGQDLFFKRGEYKPESLHGQELLAHELTHVVQQNPVQKKGKSEGQKSDEKPQIRKVRSDILQAMTNHLGIAAFNRLRQTRQYKDKKWTQQDFEVWLVQEKGAEPKNPYEQFEPSQMKGLVQEFNDYTEKNGIDQLADQRKIKEYVEPNIGMFSNFLIVDDSETHHFGNASSPVNTNVTGGDLDRWFQNSQGQGMIRDDITTICVFYKNIPRGYPVYQGQGRHLRIEPGVMGGFHRDWQNDVVQSIFKYEGSKNAGFSFRGWVDFDHTPVAEDPDNDEYAIPDPRLLNGHVHPGNSWATQNPLANYPDFQRIAELAKTLA